MARVFSDGGTMTVGRRQNHWTWGSFSVVLKVGDQQIEQNTALQDGYVYRPDDRGTGRAELTFGRADAQIDMNHESSDMEYTLDAASKRAAGDVFYTREIEGLGLANTRPGVDYEQGDMIEVVVWSQILDSVVAGVIDKATAENPNGQAVVVGENALSDAAAYRKRNSEIWNQLAKERAERIAEAARLEREAEKDRQTAADIDKIAREGRTTANTANSTANTARTTANDLRTWGGTVYEAFDNFGWLQSSISSVRSAVTKINDAQTYSDSLKNNIRSDISSSESSFTRFREETNKVFRP